MTPVIFWGATGQAKVLNEALSSTDASLVALFDNRKISSPFEGVPIYYGETGFNDWIEMSNGASPALACVAIGGRYGRDRLHRAQWLSARGYAPLTVVHSRAFVAGDSLIGEGCQILALAAVCAGARLGASVIVNTKASIDHDCVIGDGVHIAPGATIAGQVHISDFAFIGAGAVVLPNLHIGAGATVGAGAVVTRDVAPGDTVLGNPARLYQTHG